MTKTLASILFGLLLVPVVAVSSAEAKPCCQSCDGWVDGEPPIGYDYCWDNCYICSSGGNECTSNSHCGGGGLYQCMGGWCVFVGNEPMSTGDEAAPEGCGAPTDAPQCVDGVTNADGSVTCFDELAA